MGRLGAGSGPNASALAGGEVEGAVACAAGAIDRYRGGFGVGEVGAFGLAEVFAGGVELIQRFVG